MRNETKAVKITKDNRTALATRYALDLDAFPIDYFLVTVFGDDGDYRYEGVLTEEKFNEKFAVVRYIENDFFDIVEK